MKTIALFLILSGILDFSAAENQIATVNTEKQSANVLHQGVQNFRAHLTGDAEVPAKETLAVGQAIFQLNSDGTELSYKLIVSNLENITGAHIHDGAEGANGPIVVPLSTAVPGTTNGILAQGVITASDLTGTLNGLEISDLVELIESGLAYVNVHTSVNPGGEIRGQIF